MNWQNLIWSASRTGDCGTGERVGRRVGQVGVRAARAIMGQVRQVGQVGQVGEVGQVGQVGQVRRVGQVRQVGQVRRVGQVGQVRLVGELFGYRSVIVRSLFAYPSLIVYSSYIVLFVFLIFTSSKFFILLSDFDCISIC